MLLSRVLIIIEFEILSDQRTIGGNLLSVNVPVAIAVIFPDNQTSARWRKSQIRRGAKRIGRLSGKPSIASGQIAGRIELLRADIRPEGVRTVSEILPGEQVPTESIDRR